MLLPSAGFRGSHFVVRIFVRKKKKPVRKKKNGPRNGPQFVVRIFPLHSAQTTLHLPQTTLHSAQTTLHLAQTTLHSAQTT